MDSYKHSRERLFGLLVECPYIKDHQACPLNAYRDMSLKERAEMVFETMNDPEVREILRLHEHCSTCEDLDSQLLTEV